MLDKGRIFRTLYRVHRRGVFPLILLSLGSVAFLFTLEKGPLQKNHDIRMRLVASPISMTSIQTQKTTAVLPDRNTTTRGPKSKKVENRISQVIKPEDDNKPQSYLKILEYMQAEAATETILATAKRCKITYVGCFVFNYNPPMLEKQIVMNPARKTAADCIATCSRSDMAFVAIDFGRCLCGQGLMVASLQTYTYRCHSPCKDDRSQLCGGQNTVDIYRVMKRCALVNVTSDDISSSTVGCFSKSQNVVNNLPKKVLDPFLNSAKCLLLCEGSNYTIASWESLGRCACGHFTRKFSYQMLGESHNSKKCDEVNCAPGALVCNSKFTRVMRTNVDDRRCGIKKFLKPDVGKLFALLSFPGSGNTWIRYLIETATGIHTGSIYKDKTLYQKGFLGEFLTWNCRKTSIIKTHNYLSISKFEAAILIVRNPYNAIMAEYNRANSKDHTGLVPVEMFNSSHWHHFISYKAVKWSATNHIVTKISKVFVVYFEDVVADPIKEVQNIVNFLKYPIANITDRLLCLEANLSGNFKRKQRLLHFDPFPGDMKDLLNAKIREVRDTFRNLNFPPLPDYER